MAIRTVRLGSPREPDEGTRFGSVRHPPRGIRKEDYARRDYFDQWLPDLAPSADLIRWARSARFTPERWEAYRRRYLREMRRPAAQRLISLLAILSAQSDFSIGCYCPDESRCHRSLLRQLLTEAGATLVPAAPEPALAAADTPKETAASYS